MAVPELLHQLEDSDSYVRWKVGNALAQINSKVAVPGLLGYLNHLDPDVRGRAAIALSEIDREGTSSELRQLLEDRDSEVRRMANLALDEDEADTEAIETKINVLIQQLKILASLDSSLRGMHQSLAMFLVEFVRKIPGKVSAKYLPELLDLISTPAWLSAIYVLSNVQQNCQFYNYEIFRRQLPSVVNTQPSTDNSMLKELQQINQGVQKMSGTPKQDFSGATFSGHVNFASNYGSQDVTKIGTQNNYAADPKVSEALKNISQLVGNVRQKHPQASDAEILDIITTGFETMPQTNPQKWQRWQDTLSIVFAGGIEAAKMLFPPAGIPIEVGKRLYEICDRNRKQLPSS